MSLKIKRNPSSSHKCTLCDKDFATAIDFKKHEGVHTIEYPYSYGVCGKLFSSHKLLDLHQSIHTGKKFIRMLFVGNLLINEETLRCTE